MKGNSGVNYNKENTFVCTVNFVLINNRNKHLTKTQSLNFN